MLERYNSQSSTPSYHDTWPRSAGLHKGENDDRYMPPAVSLPRAKVSTLHYQPTSNIFQSYNHRSKYFTGIPKDQQNDFRYNVPLQERFHQEKF